MWINVGKRAFTEYSEEYHGKISNNATVDKKASSRENQNWEGNMMVK